MKFNPYLTFPGTCQAACLFYQSALGAKVLAMMTYKGSPMESQVPANMADQVMHARLQIGEGNRVIGDRP